MKVREQGAYIYVIGGKVGFNRISRLDLPGVKIVHLTDGKQLRGRIPTHLKYFLVLDKTAPLAEKYINHENSINPDRFQKRIDEIEEQQSQLDRMLSMAFGNDRRKSLNEVV